MRMLRGLLTVAILSASHRELNGTTAAMAEEVNYASVVFKNKKKSPREDKKEEETVYDEVKVQETTEQSSDTNTGILQDKKENNKHLQLACCLGILCVTLLLAVIAVCVYFTTFSHDSEQKPLKENITSLLAINLNLTNLNHKLTQDYRVLESKIANVTEENKNLKTQNQNLTTQNKDMETENQELEKQRNELTEKIQDMETKQNELNISRAQWSIDAYCRKENYKRKCKSCQDGWEVFQSSCYAINNALHAYRKTWDETREFCKGKTSDLAVINNQHEKKYISDNSWWSSGTNGYWIGLRAENGKWKWLDGTDLTETSWMRHPATDGQCAISVRNEEWKSVNCGDKKMWICEKAALSV